LATDQRPEASASWNPTPHLLPPDAGIDNHVGGVGMLIDAKNPDVASWHASSGALPLPQKPLSLVLPFRTIRTVLESAGKL